MIGTKILDQLNKTNFIATIGATNITIMHNGISFRLCKENRFRCIQIVLNELGLYNIYLLNFKQFKISERKVISGVNKDNLTTIIKQQINNNKL